MVLLGRGIIVFTRGIKTWRGTISFFMDVKPVLARRKAAGIDFDFNTFFCFRDRSDAYFVAGSIF